MENEKSYALAYNGTGSDLFKVQIVNLILCIVTLGLYYPWAKARKLGYIYNQTTFEQQPFLFTGTGNEMFRGFIKAFAFLFILYACLIACAFTGNMGLFQIALFLFYLIMLAIIPLVLHGSYKYRMAKTSWAGIRFGYTGDKMELVKLFFRDLFLTIITLGIYGAWFSMNLRKYIVGHIKTGDADFYYEGDGSGYFLMNLKGYFLTILTLGIYIFWWQKDIFQYFVNNLYLRHGDKSVRFQSTATAGGFASLLIINFLILIISFGLALPWVITRTLKFGATHIKVEGDIAFEELTQSQTDYSDATGEDMSGFFDFGFIV